MVGKMGQLVIGQHDRAAPYAFLFQLTIYGPATTHHSNVLIIKYEWRGQLLPVKMRQGWVPGK